MDNDWLKEKAMKQTIKSKRRLTVIRKLTDTVLNIYQPFPPQMT